jgi:putative copper resistance protein D
MAESKALTTVAWMANFGHIASAMLLFGALLFPLYTGVRSWPPHRARSAPLALASMLLLSIVLAASLTLLDITGDAASLVSVSEIKGFFLETAFGPAWLVRLAFSVAVFAVALGFAIPSTLLELRYRQRNAILLVLSAGVLISLAAVGHARAALAGGSQGFAVSSEAIHLLAAGAWIGGLPPLLFHLAGTARQKRNASLALPVLRRFSRMGQWTVILIVAGGVSTLAALMAAWNIGVSGLSQAGYSAALFVKLALLAVMLAIAAVNRFVLMPRLERPGAGITLLQRMIFIECTLGTFVIAAAVVLGGQAPPV